jgi:hypothetical protein
MFANDKESAVFSQSENLRLWRINTLELREEREVRLLGRMATQGRGVPAVVRADTVIEAVGRENTRTGGTTTPQQVPGRWSLAHHNTLVVRWQASAAQARRPGAVRS